ncbi:molybdenum cofactor synthesis domain-containing protein [Verrucomicrobiota bacterium]
MGTILAVCSANKKGIPKKNIKRGVLKQNHGVVGDAHAGHGIRQVSLLANESLDMIRERGLKIGCGGFGENITTSGIELTSIVIGTRLKAGGSLLEVTKIGKECKKPCAIYRKHGSCILPHEGVFAKVLKGGVVKNKDKIDIVRDAKLIAGILIASDRSARGERGDRCGEEIHKALKKINGRAVRYKIIPDDQGLIASILKSWSDEGQIDLLLTSGGTGFSARDVTPEATKAVLEKEAPGLSEMMRIESAKKTVFAYLSRGTAGVRKRTLIINLPGSPKAVAECMEILLPILPHAVEVMRGEVKDCHPRSSDK